jgi:predicted P-loop ATPase
MTDSQRATLRMRARDNGYGKKKLISALDDAVLAIAAANAKHPVREYLSSLSWDGEDHIAKLAGHFVDAHAPILYPNGSGRTVFHASLRRWLFGSVAKMFGDEDASRSNFVLTLAGTQGAGKSHFAQWLCPLPRFFVERQISPDDKDCSLQRTRSWVWEAKELGSTTRRADVDSLKGFITTANVTERRAFGHFNTERPAVASYIGTVNPDGAGFLIDTTGNRRFAVVELTSIDWQYTTCDIAQVWAQAVAHWRNEPKSFRFEAVESAALERNAADHMSPDVFADAIARTFMVDPKATGWRMSSTQILSALREYAGITSSGGDRAQGREVARALREHWGITSRRSNGATVYEGLILKADASA